MIDFTTGSLFKLSQCDPNEVAPQIAGLLLDGEQILVAAKTVRDFVVFTDKRIIACNIQGITGKKRDFTSLPYSKIQAFSVETAGTFDLDAELELWFSGLGKVRFEFKGRFDITYLGRLIAHHIL
ncbi:PH domain-containing protein [Curtobacterium sp. MCLR17_036]|uniref:PH domain-containing protein n=1 Tax=Curtobacterium sp. MCLR17_036 TaxID=2175620 RepID=UPI000DA89DC8|nr:PH domain-containing protein [Curtobacterium sp. MCLR17_036]WIE66221.1 PH domain-containing protein [Curtobacterium sp. MCLR17_036]